MGLPVHTLNQGKGSTGYTRRDQVTHTLLAQVAYPAGNGDPSAIAAGTPGAGYATIPAAAFATAGTGASATVIANMGVVANPTIAAAGSGGTNGAVTLTGTTGTGTKFQVTGTIAGGVLTAITGISVAGIYTVMPTTLAAEPVTGGSLTGCTLNLSAAMGVVSYTIGGASNHQYAQGTTVTLTGGTPVTPAVAGAVTVTAVAGQGSKVAISGLDLPATYAVFIGDLGQSAVAFASARSNVGLTINVVPELAASILAAGFVDILIAQ